MDGIHEYSKFTDSCAYGENRLFSVAFHNLDEYQIDIKMYDDNGKEQLIISRLQPDEKHTHEAYFTQNFFFVRSDSHKRLKAEANGIMADIFEGCLFKAKEGRLISVNISSGKPSVNSYPYMQ